MSINTGGVGVTSGATLLLPKTTHFVPMRVHPLVIGDSVMYQTAGGTIMNCGGNLNLVSTVLTINGVQIAGVQVTTIATVTALTAKGLCAGSALSSLASISSTTSDQSGAIMDNFVSLQTDIALLNIRVEALISSVRTHGLIET